MKKNVKAIIAVGLLSLVCAAGSMFAYLTDTDTATNVFTVGSVSGSLSETAFSGPKTGVYPNQEFEKNPAVTNTGSNDELVFIELHIPVDNVIVAQDDGSIGSAADTEMFSFYRTDGSSGSVNTGWSQLGSKTAVYDTVNTDEIKYYKYVFAYSGILSGDDVTPALFDNVRFANVIEDQVEDETYSIIVQADIIQADGLYADTEGKTVTSQELSDAYTKFTGQNSAA